MNRKNHPPIGFAMFLLLLGQFLVVSLASLATVQAAPYLNPKWTVTGMPNGESGVLIADINKDGYEEVIRASAGRIYVYSGTTGATLWWRSDPAMSDMAKPQMADLDGDGYLEIVVNLAHGVMAWRFPNGVISQGTIYWRRNDLSNGDHKSSPVVADIDGSGHPTVFVASLSTLSDSSSGALDGMLSSLSYDGQLLHQTFSWRPCFGGLSLADADRDGRFEVFMGDRNSGYGDGGYGRGVRCFYADDLTIKWERPEILCSSHCPVLADVNNDGLLEVLAGQNGNFCVLDSRDGSFIRPRQSDPTNFPIHFQPSCYDIDLDGRPEMLMADGHDFDSDDVVIWDLTDWVQDGRVFVGKCYYGPKAADVTGDGIMEIIACSYGGVYVINRFYSVIDSVSLQANNYANRLTYAVTQDIDRDGLVEVVVSSFTGSIWAFDTPAPKPAVRARSEVQHYSERRLGAAEYVSPPALPAAPVVSNPSPADGATNILPLSLTELTFSLKDYQHDLMQYTVTTNPVIGGGSGSVHDGTYTVPVSNLQYDTTYTWQVSVTAGTDTTLATYTFTTKSSASYDDVVFDSSFGMGNLNNVLYQSGDSSGKRFYTGEQEHTIGYDSTVSRTNTDKHWWFYFSMDNVAGKTVTISIVNNEAVDFTGSRWTEIEPVHSYDNINWERVPLSGVTYDSVAYSFTMTLAVPAGHSKVWLAPLPPYTIAKRDALFAEFSSSPYLTVSSLGTTPGGQQLKVATITDPAYSDAGKFRSYTIAQQHPGEVPGSWNAEGLIRFLLSDDPEAAAIRRSYIFKIIPIVNVDAVFEGVSRYTPLRGGYQFDLNRDWIAMAQPETQWIYADMLSFQPDSFNDFHSTINTEVTSPKEALTYSWSTTDPTLIAFRAKIKLGGYPETVTGITGSSYCAPQIHTRLGVVPSVSWENPHDELSTNPGVKLTVNDWMSWGAAWAKGNYLYFGAVQGSLATSIDGGGSITKNPDQTSYDWGTDVELTAVPAAGWTFASWSGDLSGGTNPATLTISGAHAVTAHFIPVGANAPPVISVPQPADGAVGVPLGTSSLSFTISDFDGDLMDYSVSTSPNIGSGSDTDRTDGTYSITVSGLAYSTTYTWIVSVYDGTDWTYATYTFTAEALSYDDVIFDSNFDMGNLNDVLFQSGDASGNRFYTGEQEHTTVSFADKHWWFYFSMDNVAGKTVAIKLVNNEAADFSGNRWNEIEPVYSFDNINWLRLPLSNVVVDAAARTFQMTVPSSITSGHSKIWLAPLPPYNIAKRDALFTEFALSPYLTVSSLGTTPGGQQLKVATITDPAYSDSGKFKSYVIAQQHSGEVGSWNAEGLIRYLLSDDPTAVAIRKSFIFRIVPILNVDGVYEGVSRYTPLRSGVQYDTNRQWNLALSTMEAQTPEVYWVYMDIQAFQPDSFNDMHSTINTEQVSPESVLTYTWSTSNSEFTAFMNDVRDGGWPETVRAISGLAGGAFQNVHSRLGVAFSVSWENPHDERVTNPGVKLTADDWMDWGEAWARGNYLYFVGPFNSVPVVSLPNPADGAVGVPTSTSTLSFTINDADGDLMGYSVTTSPDIGSGSATGVSDGTYSIPISGLASATTYSWTVEVNDGTDLTSATYTFTTEGAIMHTLSITIVGQGQVNLDKVGPYPAGTLVELTAVAADGWTFSGWSDDLTGDTNPESITMDSDKTVTATFTQDEYTLTVNTVGSGSVTKDPEQNTYHYGDVVELTAEADAGWAFGGWSGDLTGSANPDSVTMDGDMTVTATFTDNLRLDLSFTTDPSDSSSYNNDGVTNGGVTHTSSYGGTYVFDGSTGYITVADNPDGSLDGNGAWNKLTVELWVRPDSSPPLGQRLLRKGGTSSPYSYQVGFQTSNGRLYFDVWNGGSVLYEVEYTTLLSANTWYHIVCVYESGVGSKIYVNGVDVGAVYVQGSVSGYVAASRGVSIYIGARYKATSPYTQNWFDGFIDDVKVYSEALSGSVALAHYDASKAVHSDYALTVDIVGSGTVAMNPSQPTYAYGTSVELTAVPAEGWDFAFWSGDLSETANPATLTISGPHSVTANFIPEGENAPPIISVPEPADGAVHVQLSTSSLSFTISDLDGDLMDYSVTTSPPVGSDDVLDVGDGTYSITVSVLEYATTYTWDISVTDGTDWTYATYTFTTESIPLVIDDDFDSGSIGAYSTVGDVVSFDMVVETLTTGEVYAYWTYFKVTNTLNREITFQVTNAAQVPFLTSTINEAQMVYSYDGENWLRITTHSYSGGVYTFSQTFTGNEVYIATFFPFSYTEMQEYTTTVDSSPYVERSVLGSSEQLRDVTLLTITNPSIPIDDKTVIYIIGRQHSSETASSHMLRGMIDFLISDDPDAERLRDDFVWYIVPMVNPDGVYLGKSRATADLQNANRDWKNTETAEINLVRDHVTSIDTFYGVDFFIDWHSQMDDLTWANFVYSPSGNTFDSILEAYTDFDIQYPSTAAQGTEDDCTAREWISWNIILNPMYVLEPTPHLYTWTEALLEQQGVNVALAINEYFPTQDEYTLTITVVGSGSVSKSPDQASYHYGDSVTLTATADAGWSFDSATGWSGAGSTDGSGNRVVSITGDMTVTATFTDNLRLSLSFTTDTSDSSSYNNDGITGGGVTHVSSYGGAYAFDGSSGYINVPDNPDGSLDGNGAWDKLTIELWVRPDLASSAAQRILRKGGSTAPYSYQIGFQTTGGRLYFDVWNPNSYEVEYTTLLSANTWYHIVCVYQSGVGSKIFVNGVDVNAVQVGTGSVSGYVSASRARNLYIGCRYGTQNWFDGYIDDLQVYSEALSGSVALAHYDASKAVHADYALSVGTVGSGSVSKVPDQALYAYGSVVQLTTTAADGWTFAGWSGDLSGSANPESIAMTGSKSVTATFTQNEYTLTVNMVGSGSVVRVPDQASYHYGDSVTLTATADAGWSFDSATGWSGAGSTDGSGNRVVSITGDMTVTATFIQDEYTLSITTSGSGSVSKDPDRLTYHYGDVVQLTAVADAGWSFSAWSGDLTSSNNPESITMTGDKSVTATFTEDQYTLIVTTVGNGVVTKLPDQGTYAYGASVQLTADPDDGWSFAGWSVDLSGMNNPETIIMTGDKSVTATFTQNEYTLTVTVDPSGAGTVSADISGPYHYGDIVTLTAEANPGYAFSAWSGDVASSDNPVQVTMDGDKSITAAFSLVPVTWTITASAGTGGSITPSGAVVVADGADQSFTIAAGTGYVIADVLVDGVSVGAVSSYPFTNVVADHTITASFSLAPVYLFADGFESGSTSAWSGVSGSPVVQSSIKHHGTYAMRAAASMRSCYFNVAQSTSTIHMRSYFYVDAASASVELMRFSAGSTIVAFIKRTSTGALQFAYLRVGSLVYLTSAAGTLPLDAWHCIELRVVVGASGAYSVWLDGNPISAFNVAGVDNDNYGSVTRTYVGCIYSAGAADVYVDCAVVSKTYIGPEGVTHTIVASAGTGGSITPSGAVTLTDGGSQSFTIAANIGYEIADVLVDGVSQGAISVYDFTGVTGDHTISASFKVSGGIIFADGFESGSFSAWSGVSGTSPVVQSSIKHHGSFAMRAAGSGRSCYLAIAESTVYMRSYFYVDAASASVELMRFTAGANIVALVKRTSTGALQLGYRSGGSVLYLTSAAVTLPLDAWHCIELRTVVGASGAYSVWLDGNPISAFNVAGVDNDNFGSITRTYVGCVYSSGAADVYVDSAVVSKTYIGPQA